MNLDLSENELKVLNFLNENGGNEVSYSELYDKGVLDKSDLQTPLNLITADLMKCSINSTSLFPADIKCLSITEKGKRLLES